MNSFESLMYSVEAFAWTGHECRASAFFQAIAQLANQPRVSCSVAHLGVSRRKDRPRPASPGYVDRNGVAHWQSQDLGQLAQIIEHEYKPNVRIDVVPTIRLHTGREACVFLDCFGEDYFRQYCAGPIRLQIDGKDLWPSDVEVPTVVSSVEDVRAFGSYLGAKDVDGLLMGIAGVNELDEPLHISWASLGCEGRWHSSFGANAAIFVCPIELKEDLARSWLVCHTGLEMKTVASAHLDELRSYVRHSQEETHKRERESADGYDGSVSREAILRAVDIPIDELLGAFSAACLPSESARMAETTAVEVRDLLPNTVERTMRDVQWRGENYRPLPYFIPRFQVSSSGAVLLGSGPGQILWPLYKDVFALLDVG